MGKAGEKERKQKSTESWNGERERARAGLDDNAAWAILDKRGMATGGRLGLCRSPAAGPVESSRRRPPGELLGPHAVLDGTLVFSRLSRSRRLRLCCDNPGCGRQSKQRAGVPGWGCAGGYPWDGQQAAGVFLSCPPSLHPGRIDLRGARGRRLSVSLFTEEETRHLIIVVVDRKRASKKGISDAVGRPKSI